MECRNYLYGAKPPIEGVEAINVQMVLAHYYYNQLVTIELDRRKQSDELLRLSFPDYAALEKNYLDICESINVAFKAIRDINRKLRKRVELSAEDKIKLAELKVQREEAFKAYSIERKRAFKDPLIKDRLKAINDAAYVAQKTVRADPQKILVTKKGYTLSPFAQQIKDNNLPLYWGNKAIVEDALRDIGKGSPPKYRSADKTESFEVEGSLANQLQGGLSSSKISSPNTLAWIEPLPASYWKRGLPSSKWKLLHFRVMSDAKNKPVWMTIPFAMHRPLPADSKIKWVKVFKRKIGAKFDWSVMFVVQSEKFEDRSKGYGRVAIDLGWTKTDKGIRVALAVGEDNKEHELLIPNDEVDRWTKATSIQSIQDREFDSARDTLSTFLANPICPAWLKEAAEGLIHWRAPARLCIVVKIWESKRFDGDELIFAKMQAWMKQNFHLFEWACNQRRKNTAWRDHLYRNFAAKIGELYDECIVNKVDWKSLAKNADPDEDTKIHNRLNQKVASPARLLTFIKEKIKTNEVVIKNLSNKCYKCAVIAKLDNKEVIHECSCGSTWTVPQNRCFNLLLASGEVMA